MDSFPHSTGCRCSRQKMTFLICWHLNILSIFRFNVFIFLWDIQKDSLFVSGMRCEQWRAEISVKDCAFFSDLPGHFHWSSWSHSSFPQAAHMFKWLCARFIFHPPNVNVEEFFVSLFRFLTHFFVVVWFWKAHTFADCFSAGDLSSVCLKTIINSEDWRRATHAASTELVHFLFFSQHSELLSNLHHWNRLKMRGRSTFWPLDTSQHWRPCCRSRPSFESSELC